MVRLSLRAREPVEHKSGPRIHWPGEAVVQAILFDRPCVTPIASHCTIGTLRGCCSQVEEVNAKAPRNVRGRQVHARIYGQARPQRNRVSSVSELISLGEVHVQLSHMGLSIVRRCS